MDDIKDPTQLTTVYKKTGTFDNQRKILLENFKQSETHNNLLMKLKLLVESKVKNDPDILLKNKGKVSALIQGEVINSKSNGMDILNVMDKEIQKSITNSPEFRSLLKSDLKDIRRKLLGISDEEYQKQLEAERVEENAKKEKLEERRTEEKSYKNNFKVKNLSKVLKPPRFNFKKEKEEKKVNFMMY